jgi:hypothetical protein
MHALARARGMRNRVGRRRAVGTLASGELLRALCGRMRLHSVWPMVALGSPGSVCGTVRACASPNPGFCCARHGQAYARFGARLMLVNRSIVHSGMQQTQDNAGKQRQDDGFTKVMADWWLMGEMDGLVGTGSYSTTHPKGCKGGSRSSFGVSAAWRRCVPVVLLPAEAHNAACLGNLEVGTEQSDTAPPLSWSVVSRG